MFSRQKMISTVMMFDGKESAQNALRTVRGRVRSTAFVVHVSEWCSQPRLNPSTGVYECQ